MSDIRFLADSPKSLRFLVYISDIESTFRANHHHHLHYYANWRLLIAPFSRSTEEQNSQERLLKSSKIGLNYRNASQSTSLELKKAKKGGEGCLSK